MMNFRLHVQWLCFLLFILSLSSRCYAQVNYPDSLKASLLSLDGLERQQVYQNLFEYYLDQDSIAATLWAGELISLGQKEARHDIEVEGLVNLARTSIITNNYQKAIAYLESADDLSHLYSYQRGEALVQNYNGVISYYINDYDRAMEYYMPALEYAEREHDMDLLYAVYNNVAVIHASNNEMERALEFFRKSQKLARQLKDLTKTVRTNINIGLIYAQDEDWAHALDAFNHALKISQDHNHLMLIAAAHNNIGSLFIKRERYAEALSHFNSALVAAKKVQEKTLIGNVLLNIGKCYVEQDSLVIAKKYFNEAYLLSRKINNLFVEQQATFYLSGIYELQGDFSQSMKFMRDSYLLKDSLYSEKSQRLIYDLEVQYELKEKERIIKFMEEKRASTLKFTVLLVFFLIGMGILAVLGMVSYRQKNRLLNKESELDQMRLDQMKKDQEMQVLALENSAIEARQREAENRRLQEELETKEQINTLEKEKLASEIRLKNRELATSTLHIVNKNETLEHIRTSLQEVMQGNSVNMQKMVMDIVDEIENSIQLDQDWKRFKIHFESVHNGFFTRLIQDYPLLTHNELKLCSYIRINLSSKEIAQILNITPSSVDKRRQRLRKKLVLENDINLVEFLTQF